MISFRLQFSDEEVASLFRRHGLTLTEVTFKQHIPVYHNKTDEEQITTLCVVNPHNRKAIPVSIAFERVMLSLRQQLFLDEIDKLTVLNALK